jgi:HPt (histidine-containing phosphotransfer) domain-containing protein
MSDHFPRRDSANADDLQEVEIITPPNTLKEKLGGDPRQPLRFDPTLIADAESKFAQFASDFLGCTRVSLARLSTLIAESQADQGGAAPRLKEASALAREIASEAGTFGYMLLSDIARSLEKFVLRLDAADRHGLDIVRVHLDALETVLREDVKHGGREGVELRMLLRRATARR